MRRDGGAGYSQLNPRIKNASIGIDVLINPLNFKLFSRLLSFKIAGKRVEVLKILENDIFVGDLDLEVFLDECHELQDCQRIENPGVEQVFSVVQIGFRVPHDLLLNVIG
jgi:hypothetical protein